MRIKCRRSAHKSHDTVQSAHALEVTVCFTSGLALCTAQRGNFLPVQLAGEVIPWVGE